MNNKKWINYLTLSIFITSCASKTPETIIGIKLGSMANTAVKQAENSGLLLTDSHGSYITLPNDIKGYTMFYTTIKNNFLNEVTVRFCSNKNPWNEILLNISDKSTIVELYEKKYGTCRAFKVGDQNVFEPNQLKSGPTNEPGNYYEYYWKKDHLVLNLSFMSFDQYGKGFFTAVARYKFDEEYEEEIKEVNKPKTGI